MSKLKRLINSFQIDFCLKPLHQCNDILSRVIINESPDGSERTGNLNSEETDHPLPSTSTDIWSRRLRK